MADLSLSLAFNAQDLQNAINSVVNRQYSIRGINVSSIQQPLGRITSSASEFEKSMGAANARVLAFGASASAILVVQRSLESLVGSTINVEKSIAEINTVLNLSERSLSSFSSQIFQAANSVSVSFDDASQAALEFARQGLSVEETLKRTRDSLVLAKIAGMDFANSATAITAALNSFSNELITSSDLVDRLTNADANFAVSASDLAEAIKRVGSSAADANVSLNETIALVTSAQQTTARGGAVIGNSFKTIFTRLGRSSVLNDLERIGVATNNAAGETLPLVQILKNLSSTYDSLSGRQKNFVAELVGGVYQINILKATLGDISNEGGTFESVLRTVENSAGSAASRINILNETISGKLVVTLNNASRLASSVGNKTIAPIFKGVLDQSSSGLESVAELIDGEGIGSKIANGMLGALKGILQGPGAALFGFIAAKLAGNFGSFIGDSASSFLGLNSAAKQQAEIQGQILNYLQSNPAILQNIYNGSMSVAQGHMVVLGHIKQQNALLSYQQQIASQIANIRPAGPASPSGGTPAAGFIPNFNSQMAGQMMENAGAREHGYTAGRAYKTTVHDGNGNAIPTFVNSRETVDTFTNSEGRKATMVTPPNGFGKGTMRAARGFVPNFGPKPRVGIEGEERELGRGSGRRAFLRYADQGTATPANAYVVKTPHRTGERRPEAVADAIGQQKQSEDFAAGLEKFPWFEAVPQKHVGGGVLKQPLAKGDTLGQVLREAYPNYGTNAISGVLGSFDKFFQKIGLPFDRRGTPGNIIIPEERKQQLMQILRGPVGNMYAKMFGHKGGFPMDANPDAKPGDKPEPWFKLIDYAKGFVPNFGKKRLINQEGGASDGQREKLTEMFASVTREEPIGASALAFEMLEGNRGTPWVDQALADFETFKNHYTNDYTNNRVTTEGMDLNDPENVAFLRGQWGSRYFKKKIGKKGMFDRYHLLNPGTRPTAAGGFVPNFADSKKKKFKLKNSRDGSDYSISAGEGSSLDFSMTDEGFEIGFNESAERGAGFAQFEGLVKMAKKRNLPILSGEIEPQVATLDGIERQVELIRAGGEYAEEDEYSGMNLVKGKATNFDALKAIFPQLSHRMIAGITTSGSYAHSVKSGPRTLSDYFNFENLSTIRDKINVPSIKRKDYDDALIGGNVDITDLITSHVKGRGDAVLRAAGGFVPNFARILDFDGTLGTAPPGITHKDTYEGWSASKMIPTPLVDKVRKEQEALRKAGKPIEDTIVTARGRESIPFIAAWLKEQGLSVADIRATGDKERYPEGMTTPDKKVLEIKDAGMLKPGTVFSDDDKKNLTAAKRAAKKEGVKGFKTNLVNYGNKGIGQMAGGLIPNFGMVSAQVSAMKKGDAREMSRAISGENADPKRQKQHEQALKFEELSARAVGNKMISDYPVTSLTSIPTKNLKGAAGFGGGKNFPGYDSIYKLLTSNENLAQILGVQINQPSYVPLSAKGGSNIKIAEIKRQMEKGGQVISELKKNGGLEDLGVGNSILAQASSPAKGIPELFSDKGSFGEAGYVSKIARASGGFVPNFYNPEEREKKLEERARLIDRNSPEGIVAAKALENFRARQAVSEGLNDADQKFITDNEKGILRAYKIGALDSGSDFMNAKAGEPNSTYASRGGLPGGIADKLRGIVGKKGGRTAVFDLARNRGVTALAGGFVPNFEKTSVFRGVGGSRLLQEYQERNLTPTAEQIQESIFKKKELDNPRGSQLANLRAQGGTTIKEKRNAAFGDEFSLENLAIYLSAHQRGLGDRGTGLISTTLKKEEAEKFAKKNSYRANPDGHVGEISMPNSRIMNTAKLEKMTKRFGAKRVAQVLRNSRSEANAAKGRKNKFVGFDVKDITEGHFGKEGARARTYQDYSEEQEIALMAGGFVPNFASGKAKSFSPAKVLFDKVHDGDSLIVDFTPKADQSINTSTRLKGYNAPELKTDEGQKAKDITKKHYEALSTGSDITSMFEGAYDPTGKDKYLRPFFNDNELVKKLQLGGVKLEKIDKGGSKVKAASGFIPNFNALKDSVGRERAAGYSASQIRIGSSKSLVTSSNPGGMGVYNSTERNLAHGISLATGAGIEPKTKGASKGFIPNFAVDNDSTGLAVMGSVLVGVIAAIKEHTDAVKADTQAIEDKKAAINLSKKRKDEDTPINEAETRLTNRRATTDARIAVDRATAAAKPGAPVAGSPAAAALQAQYGREDAIRAQGRLKVDNRAGGISARRATLASTRKGEDDAAATAEIAKSEEKNKKDKKHSKVTKIAAGVSAAGGAVAGTLDPGPAKAAMSAFSSSLSLASSAVAAFPGPVGLAIGAVVSIVGAGIAIAKLTSTSEALKEKAELMKQDLADFSSASKGVVSAYQAYQDSIYDVTISSEKVTQLNNEIAIAMAKLPDAYRADFEAKMRSAGSQGERANIQSEMQSRMSKDTAVTERLAESSGKTSFDATKSFVADQAGKAQGRGSNRYTNTEVFYTTEQDRKKQKKELDKDVFSITESATSTKEKQGKFRELAVSDDSTSDFRKKLADLVPEEARDGIEKMKDAELALLRARFNQIETARRVSEMLGKVMDPLIKAERETKRGVQEEINLLRERSVQLKALASSLSTLGVGIAAGSQNARVRSQSKSFSQEIDFSKGQSGAKTGVQLDAQRDMVQGLADAAETQRNELAKVFKETMSKGTGTNERGEKFLTPGEIKTNQAISKAMESVDLASSSDPAALLKEIISKTDSQDRKAVEKKLASDPALLEQIRVAQIEGDKTRSELKIGNDEQKRIGEKMAQRKQDSAKFGGIENFLNQDKRREATEEFGKGITMLKSNSSEQRGEGSLRILLQAQKDLGGSLSEEGGVGKELEGMAVKGRTDQIIRGADQRIRQVQSSNLSPQVKQTLIKAFQEQKSKAAGIAATQVKEATQLERVPLDSLSELKSHSASLKALSDAVMNGVVIKTPSDLSDVIAKGIAGASKGDADTEEKAKKLSSEEKMRQESSAKATRSAQNILSDKDFAEKTASSSPEQKKAEFDKRFKADSEKRNNESNKKVIEAQRKAVSPGASDAEKKNAKDLVKQLDFDKAEQKKVVENVNLEDYQGLEVVNAELARETQSNTKATEYNTVAIYASAVAAAGLVKFGPQILSGIKSLFKGKAGRSTPSSVLANPVVKSKVPSSIVPSTVATKQAALPSRGTTASTAALPLRSNTSGGTGTPASILESPANKAAREARNQQTAARSKPQMTGSSEFEMPKPIPQLTQDSIAANSKQQKASISEVSQKFLANKRARINTESNAITAGEFKAPEITTAANRATQTANPTTSSTDAAIKASQASQASQSKKAWNEMTPAADVKPGAKAGGIANSATPTNTDSASRRFSMENDTANVSALRKDALANPGNKEKYAAYSTAVDKATKANADFKAGGKPEARNASSPKGSRGKGIIAAIGSVAFGRAMGETDSVTTAMDVADIARSVIPESGSSSLAKGAGSGFNSSYTGFNRAAGFSQVGQNMGNVPSLLKTTMASSASRSAAVQQVAGMNSVGSGVGRALGGVASAVGGAYVGYQKFKSLKEEGVDSTSAAVGGAGAGTATVAGGMIGAAFGATLIPILGPFGPILGGVIGGIMADKLYSAGEKVADAIADKFMVGEALNNQDKQQKAEQQDRVEKVQESKAAAGGMENEIFNRLVSKGMDPAKAMEKAQDLIQGEKGPKEQGGKRKGDNSDINNALLNLNSSTSSKSAKDKAKITLANLENTVQAEEGKITKGKGDEADKASQAKDAKSKKDSELKADAERIRAADEKYGVGMGREYLEKNQINTSFEERKKVDATSNRAAETQANFDKFAVKQQLTNVRASENASAAALTDKEADGSKPSEEKAALLKKNRYLAMGGKLDTSGNVPTPKEAASGGAGKIADPKKQEGIQGYIELNTKALNELTTKISEILRGNGDQTNKPNSPGGGASGGKQPDSSASISASDLIELNANIVDLSSALQQSGSAGGRIDVLISKDASSEAQSIEFGSFKQLEAAVDEIKQKMKEMADDAAGRAPGK